MTPQLLVAVQPTLNSMQQQDPPFNRLVEGITLLLILIIISLSFAGFVILLVTLLPNISDRSRAALQQTPWRAFFIGLANYLFLGGLSLLLMSTEIPPLSLIGLIMATALTLVTTIGLSGLILFIGQRLVTLSGRNMSPLMQVITGTITLELALLLPFVGWFLLTPIILMLSFGLAVLAWRNPSPQEAWE